MAASLAVAVLVLALLTMLPGPDLAVVTRLASSRGRARVFRGSLGIVSGVLVRGLSTVAGLAALLAAYSRGHGVRGPSWDRAGQGLRQRPSSARRWNA